MNILGDDPDTQNKEGCTSGEQITFKIAGLNADPSTSTTWDNAHTAATQWNLSATGDYTPPTQTPTATATATKQRRQPKRHPNTDGDPHADTHQNADRLSLADAHRDGDGHNHTHCDRNAHPDRNTHRDRDAHGHRVCDSHGYAYPHADSYRALQRRQLLLPRRRQPCPRSTPTPTPPWGRSDVDRSGVRHRPWSCAGDRWCDRLGAAVLIAGAFR